MCAEVKTTAHYPVPLLLCHCRESVAADAHGHEAIHHAGIEVVTGTDGANHLDRLHRVTRRAVLGEKTYIAIATCEDEVGAIELYLFLVNLVGVGHLIEVCEVIGRTTHHIGKLKVLDESLGKLYALGSVCLAEVYIVVEQRATFVGILKECLCLCTQHRVEHKV